ncbi:Short-chain dehydrogenase/reductase family 16C member 6 [Habropoda laboriosa]|uniref:Short-chain dehydrogenase/reductase 3 n=2 Tax=Habropoda laboriosa TaxID=597456 RepID=A0A0L7QV45_9HYME|nr:PREDICTED: short-chain dehydrogenase/reductase family 16C member 6-like isoform X2 [Habropoda laboriosa]XP_017793026.1 PREDICTED: short-chain dehydrogenase/reductase family 16C member 6-like isoform X2 [Habropoda laboriosa]XP_017793027.1 PREDICTED: short-chain dehydrogenase/reductase family 16C member 6-like isoform X2 [Habropoda laboriosa]KOC62508.1 Short-chain dehydrogenase/reductase family 16C member 6 [Habropoda laboriosa]
MVRAYGGVLVLADVLLLLLKILYYIGEGIYRLLVPVEEKSVAGEIVLVTGAGHGIGKELALKYASLGATVVCWDLNQQGNEETVNEIKQISATTKAYGYKCDVSKREEVFKVAEKVRVEVGNVTILINNAGIMPCRAFLDHTPEDIKRIFDINVLAHCWTVQAFLPSMIQKNYGHIVALSSMAGFLGVANVAPYCASKFAVRGLMEALNEEIRSLNKEKTLNINFTTIYPYMVDTGLCKKPRIRFPSIMALVSPKEAVVEIVKAQRRNIRELSIPACWLYINILLRCAPESCMRSIVDFLDSGLETES